nr:hypothetical protein [Tanacetum cinerariifolium]
MANPNPENLNVPNEGIPEEDPHHLLDYDEEEDPKLDIEEEEPEEEPVDDDDDVEEDDDAEIIFPYEVQGDQTPPPRDESSDSEPEAEEDDDEPEAEEADDELEVKEAGVEPKAEGADVELEAEEPDGAPKDTIGTGSQRPFAFIRGLAPWALRRDLEALRRHERIREAESEMSRTEVVLLGSEAKIGKTEREILHHDLSGVEETLGKRDRAEKRLSESIWWNERFYLEMVRKGAVPKSPSDDEGSERPKKMPKKSDEDEGPSDPRGPLM